MVAKQITNNSVSDIVPEIDGNFIVWGTPLANVIYFYDILTGITHSSSYDEPARVNDPDISGNRIVFTLGFNDYGTADLEYFTTDFSARDSLTNNSNDEYNSSIDGNLVVYEYIHSPTDLDIYLYDFSTDTTRVIAGSAANQVNPKISGNRIVWQEDDGNDWEIWTAFSDGSGRRQLTFNSRDDISPSISGNLIVYTDTFQGLFGDIIIYDLTTNTTTSIVDSQNGKEPDINGNKVVWSQDDEIWFAATDGSNKTQITFNLMRDVVPKISGNNVVWMGYDENDWEIFTQRIFPDPIYRFYNPVSQGHFFTANVAEKDNILAHPEWGYNFEDVGFKAIKDISEYGYDPLLKPIYRFYNPVSQGHFFTANVAEKDNILAHPEWGYNFEDVGFYAYGADDQQASDIYRFYNPVTQGHFFTASILEKDTVLANPSWGYQFEGVGFEAMI